MAESDERDCAAIAIQAQARGKIARTRLKKMFTVRAQKDEAVRNMAGLYKDAFVMLEVSVFTLPRDASQPLICSPHAVVDRASGETRRHPRSAHRTRRLQRPL